MSEAPGDGPQPNIGAALQAAADVVDRWGASTPYFTGRWLDPRNATIGVGVSDDHDDEAAREHLQALVPAGVRVRVRLVSPEWVRLRRLQVRISDYLDDCGYWSLYAVALGIEDATQRVVVGLLPGTPDSVADQIRAEFPTHDVVLDREARPTIAL